MKNILDNFQQLSFNQKVAASIGTLTVFIIVIVLAGLGIRSLMPKAEIKPEETYISTPEPSSTEVKENINKEGQMGAELSQEAAQIMNQISPLATEASIQICSQNTTESAESKTARLSPYVSNVEEKIKANVFGISGYSQTCRSLGDYFESYDSKTKTMNFTSTMIEDFVPLSQAGMPESEQVHGSRYSSYTLSFKQQKDGSWKVDTINGR